ncbi:MAG: hypothetical protein H6557_18135 [Lewinellaceae bacterium]|nr:hypothetical protein [Lewinellaceae bacterium]
MSNAAWRKKDKPEWTVYSFVVPKATLSGPRLSRGKLFNYLFDHLFLFFIFDLFGVSFLLKDTTGTPLAEASMHLHALLSEASRLRTYQPAERG